MKKLWPNNFNLAPNHETAFVAVAKLAVKSHEAIAKAFLQSPNQPKNQP